MQTQDTLQNGLELLAQIHPDSEAIAYWKEFLLHQPERWQSIEEPYVWLSCVQALMAAREGNYGIGSLLVDGNGEVVLQGRNQSFYPTFRTDLHAEMNVLNQWEMHFPNDRYAPDYTLYSSLEPCPMCLSRLITTSIHSIRYVAIDKLGGMVRLLNQLPPIYVELAQRQSYTQAHCAPELQDAALRILHINMHELNERLK